MKRVTVSPWHAVAIADSLAAALPGCDYEIWIRGNTGGHGTSITVNIADRTITHDVDLSNIERTESHWYGAIPETFLGNTVMVEQRHIDATLGGWSLHAFEKRVVDGGAK